jgi:hypothetical protein
MSYRRWSDHSNWYAWNDTRSGDTLDTQFLGIGNCKKSDVNTVGAFTYVSYESLKNDRQAFIDEVTDGVADDEKQLGLLDEIINDFMEDMEEQYKS